MTVFPTKETEQMSNKLGVEHQPENVYSFCWNLSIQKRAYFMNFLLAVSSDIATASYPCPLVKWGELGFAAHVICLKLGLECLTLNHQFFVKAASPGPHGAKEKLESNISYTVISVILGWSV